MDNIPNWLMALCSIGALIISIIPYIKIFKGKKLDFDVLNSISISHHIGNPMIDIPIIIRNTGGRRIKLQNITIELKRDNKLIDNFNVMLHYNPSGNNQLILFHKPILNIEQEWNIVLRFFNRLETSDNNELKKAEIKLRKEITRLQELNRTAQTQYADNNFTNPFTKIFDKYFIWEEGSYYLKINIIAEDNKIFANKEYRFSVFETIKEQFQEDKKRFSTGDRIWFYNEPPYNWQPIELENIN